MYEAVQKEYHEKWTADQIEWVERQGYSLSPAVSYRKNELSRKSPHSTPHPVTAPTAQQPPNQTAQNLEAQLEINADTAVQPPEYVRQRLNIQPQPVPH